LTRSAIEALNTIKSILKIENVTVEKDKRYCSFVVQNFSVFRVALPVAGSWLLAQPATSNQLQATHCPIFLQFPLLICKNLDFQDFYKAVLIKK